MFVKQKYGSAFISSILLSLLVLVPYPVNAATRLQTFDCLFDFAQTYARDIVSSSSITTKEWSIQKYLLNYFNCPRTNKY